MILASLNLRHCESHGSKRNVTSSTAVSSVLQQSFPTTRGGEVELE
jgi:hypothetical protein